MTTKVGLRLRTLADGTLVVARIDPETHEQLEDFRPPEPHEVPYIEQHRPSATPAPADKVREAAPSVEMKIGVSGFERAPDGFIERMLDFFGRDVH